jgi:ABC-type multidrug transport system ATPase subunit
MNCYNSPLSNALSFTVGKTTTISTLTGMIEASSGDASIYGCSLQYDLPAIRQLTGVW